MFFILKRDFVTCDVTCDVTCVLPVCYLMLPVSPGAAPRRPPTHTTTLGPGPEACPRWPPQEGGSWGSKLHPWEAHGAPLKEPLVVSLVGVVLKGCVCVCMREQEASPLLALRLCALLLLLVPCGLLCRCSFRCPRLYASSSRVYSVSLALV